jgi:hypothetical protein
LERTIQLEIASEATNFIIQILAFPVYGGSCSVKTLNQTSIHMWWMVRIEVEIPTSVGGHYVDFSGHCHLLSDDQNIKKLKFIVCRYFHSELDGRLYTIKVAGEVLELLWAMRPDHKCIFSVAEPQRWFMLCRVKSQILEMLNVDVANDS